MAATSAGTTNPNEGRCMMVGWWDIWCWMTAPLAWCSFRSAIVVGRFVWWLSGWLVCWFAQFCPVAPLEVLCGGSDVAGCWAALYAAGWGHWLLSLSGWRAYLLWRCCPSMCWVSCLLDPLALFLYSHKIYKDKQLQCKS